MVFAHKRTALVFISTIISVFLTECNAHIDSDVLCSNVHDNIDIRYAFGDNYIIFDLVYVKCTIDMKKSYAQDAGLPFMSFHCNPERYNDSYHESIYVLAEELCIIFIDSHCLHEEKIFFVFT